MSGATMETKKLLAHLRQGDAYEAFEAAKSLSTASRISPKQIVKVLIEARTVHNREAAVYTLSWLFRRDKDEALQALLSIFNAVNENPAVRAQALEGFGVQAPTQRCKSWPAIERAVLMGLRDKAVEVRFWACYAAGTLRMERALSTLRELAWNDFEVCPNWWRVSEEAADAIEWIFGQPTEDRVPIQGTAGNRGDA